MSSQAMNVRPHEPVPVSIEGYPWISERHEQVPTVSVTFTDGTTFLYGSLIGLNKSVMRIADSVPASDSISAQTALFSGLPSVLQGKPAPGISKVEKSDLLAGTLFVASRSLVRGPNLVFVFGSSSSENQVPTILRAGISTGSEYPRLLGLMGIRQARGQRRRT